MKKNTKIKSRSMFYFSVLYQILLAVQRKNSIFSNTSRDILSDNTGCANLILLPCILHFERNLKKAQPRQCNKFLEISSSVRDEFLSNILKDIY